MDDPLGLGEMAKSPARQKMQAMRLMIRILIMTVVNLVKLHLLNFKI